ncbi:MAG TPA: anhydro-N-acetylmuramic acid kinase [Limnobacter sp.]|nr:anhydro-N-acetylmuramic acid kinase [Limnobacter sp.]
MIILGAMSGTSTDGVDVAALHADPSTASIRFVGHRSESFDPQLRQRLLDLQHVPALCKSGEDLLGAMLACRRDLTLAYARAVYALINELGIEARDVRVLGAHGQTLRHRPDLGFTYQMLDGALLAVQTGLDVVCDFRSKDVALGGQGAPLVPAFHQAWLASKGLATRSAVLNLGGFSNLTVLQGVGLPVLGGDCGPANCLMDLWAKSKFGLEFDEGGGIAALGRVDESLLAELLAHPFLSKAWPKSTGRDDFNAEWLDRCIASAGQCVANEDVMATLLAMAVEVVKACLPSGVDRMFVCGGGASNEVLVTQLALSLAPVEVCPIEDLGLPAQAVEAAAFAWLAMRSIVGEPSNCPTVTGARGPAVLGALHLCR